MCFVFAALNKDLNPLIADEDIICFKLMRNTSFNFHLFRRTDERLKYIKRYIRYKRNKILVSDIQAYEYLLNVMQPHVNLKVISSPSYPHILEGYHSFINSDFYVNRRHNIIVECIIPAGAAYYMNEIEYVSSTIILKRIM